MFKRSEETIMDDYRLPAKRAKFDNPNKNLEYRRTQEEIPTNRNAQNDDLWGDDFDEEDIEEMDLIASQACVQEANLLNNLKLFEHDLNSMKSGFPEKTTAIAYNETSCSKLAIEKPNSRLLKKNIQGTSQDITEINYSQFRNKLIDKKDYNSTFQKDNFIVQGDKELEKLKTENKKLLNDFITKDGETAFLRQQLQQTQLRIENEKLEKMRLIEEQANRHRSEINKIYKEKEQLKTQLELQDLEIGNLQERCKLLESGNIKLKEPQMLYMNTSVDRCKYATPTNRTTNINKNLKVKEACVQANVYKKSDYQLKTYNTYIPLARISELIFGASLPEKSIVNIKVIEKTGRRNLPILQEEETFRIFENPELVKPIVTTVNGKRLTTEFVLLEITAIERRVNTEIESERCIPIINKLVLTTRELILNVITVLETIFQAMKNDDIRDMNDLYFSMVYKDHNICIKSECEADAWHEGERGVEARRLLGILSYISIESSYLSNYIAGKSQLLTRSDECYNHYLQQMTRYNTWSKKGYEFEMLEIILECVTLIERVRRSHQFTGLINAIIKLLCNVQQKVGYCDKGLEYIYLIFKELVFSRPLSLCYVSLANFIMVFSKCNVFVSKLCTNSQLITIKRWKGVLHFTPDACVLQIYMAQVEHFYPDFFTAVNMTYALISSVWHLLQKNNLLRSESSESCNCYTKLLRFIINMLKKCSENKLDIIDNTEWQNSYYASKKFLFKRINYKDHACQMKCNKQNMEKHLAEIYSEKLDRNFWFDIKKIHYKVLRQGIRFLCHLAICDPDFVIRSSDIEDSFHLFIRNIAFFDDLILHENERKYHNACISYVLFVFHVDNIYITVLGEALDRIKTTFIVDKDVQCETETRYENTHVNQLHMTNFEKKVTPTTERSRHTGPIENYNKVYMAIKALYNSKSTQR